MKELTNQPIFLVNVYIGNIPTDDTQAYLDDFRKSFKFMEEFSNITVYYAPTRDIDKKLIERIN